jgi:catechol-2,3-dioxygenase
MGASPRLVHVVLQTRDLPAAVDWYCALLHGHVVYQSHGLAFVTHDDEHHRIAFVQLPPDAEAKSPAAAGLNHIAFTFESLDDLLDRYTELAAKGIRPVTPVQHGMTTSLYYRDPDGNKVEFQVDNFATPDEATAYMREAEFDADPVGPAFDVDRMIAARQDGTPVAELTTRKWARSGPPQPNPLPLLMA